MRTNPTDKNGPAARPSDPPATPVGGRGDRQAREIAAEDARQGKIVLTTKTRRIVFIAGLAGFVLLAIMLRLAAVI